MEQRKYQIQSWRQNRVALPKAATITGVTELNSEQGLYWLHVTVDPEAKQVIRIVNAFNNPEIGPTLIAMKDGLFFWDLGEIPHNNLIPEVVGVYELDTPTA